MNLQIVNSIKAVGLTLMIDDDKSRFDILVGKKLLPEEATYSSNAADGIKLLASRKWDTLYLDHDLGERLDGTDIAKAIVNLSWTPNMVVIHSTNSNGAARMRDILRCKGIDPVLINIKDIYSAIGLYDYN